MNQPAEQGPDVSMRRSTSRGDRFSSYLPAEVTFLVKDLSRSLVEVTQAEYEQRVNRVIDHVREHLAEPLPLAELARVAAFSPFHFHRVFRAITGETLFGFIQRQRIEKAAGALLLPAVRASLRWLSITGSPRPRPLPGRSGPTSG